MKEELNNFNYKDFIDTLDLSLKNLVYTLEASKLICDENNQSQIAKKLKSEGNLTTHIIIAAVSSYVGDILGFAAALCSPFVVLSLALILKANMNVFCNSYNIS